MSVGSRTASLLRSLSMLTKFNLSLPRSNPKVMNRCTPYFVLAWPNYRNFLSLLFSFQQSPALFALEHLCVLGFKRLNFRHQLLRLLSTVFLEGQPSGNPDSLIGVIRPGTLKHSDVSAVPFMARFGRPL